jgi:hypothetical protein
MGSPVVHQPIESPFQIKQIPEPVQGWIKDLDKEDRLIIGIEIKTVEFG